MARLLHYMWRVIYETKSYKYGQRNTKRSIKMEAQEKNHFFFYMRNDCNNLDYNDNDISTK